MNAHKLFLVLMIVTAIISIIDGAVQEGKCNGKCERGKIPHARCIKSGRPCNRSCRKPNEPCRSASKQNYCQCDDGYVRQFKFGGKWDCVEPANCKQTVDDYTFS